MIAGRLNRRIVIEHVVHTHDDVSGEERPTVREIHTRAGVRFNSQGRADAMGDVYLRSDITFVLWGYFKDIVGDYDHIIYEGRRYRVDSVEPDDAHMTVYIKATRENG